MFLTRLGFGSKMVVTGDVTQVDLPRDQRSGPARGRRHPRGVEGVDVHALRRRGRRAPQARAADRRGLRRARRARGARAAAGRPSPATGLSGRARGRGDRRRAPRGAGARGLRAGAASAGVERGHVAVEFVDAERIAELNAAHRGKEGPTDVLSFPVDERGASVGPRELGDVVICPEHTEDLLEAVVHGVLHLTGMDHETDDGEMLALQAEIRSWLGDDRAPARASSRSPGARTSASRRSSTRSSATRSRSSPTSRRRPGARSAAWSTVPDRWQLVLTDLPGRAAPARRADRSACSAASRTSSRSPTPRCSCSTASRASAGPGDRFIAEALRRREGRRSVIAVNKVDRDPPRPDRRRAAGRRRPRPRRRGLPDLRPHRARRRRRSSSTSPALLPEGPFYFPRRGGLRPARAACMLAELVREQVLRRTRQEVPHAVEVQVDEIERARRPDRRARAAVGGDRVPEGDPDRRPRAR